MDPRIREDDTREGYIIKMKTQKKQKNKMKGLPGSAFRTRKTTTGFTVLFAVIVSSLILALGLGIVAITMKEVKLSGTGRDSELAFYAADSGLECAQYFDLVKSAFATSSESTGMLNPIKCNNHNVTVTELSEWDTVSAISTFPMYMEYTGDVQSETKPCAKVTVSKTIIVDGGVSKQHTVIDSRGYNTCDENNARRLERGYRVEY